ncbi:MAG: magnesium/cobalt transporter CorA [Armatimonadetes bacterium]|nr:magnesium/cobalt transporter CorA [Armatimonadota bacterium]
MELEKAFSGKAASWSSKEGVRPTSLGEASTKCEQRHNNGPDTLLWTALEIRDTELARNSLRNDFGFHPVAIDDAVSDNERPGAFIGPDYVFVTIPVVETSSDGDCFRHVGAFVAQGAVVTVTSGPSSFVDEWFGRWSAHPVEVGSTSDMLLQELLDAAVDDYFPALDRLQEEVDALEESVYAGGPITVGAAVRLRRSLLEMRRQVTPIRDIMNLLLRRDTPVVGNEARTYFQDIYDHTLRLLESIDLNRDILTSIMDAQLSMTSNRLNEVMRNMTSLATILMVMALVTGVYGMNFEHMPELHWRYGYPIVVAWLFAIFFGGLFIASRIGWFTVKWPWKQRPK